MCIEDKIKTYMYETEKSPVFHADAEKFLEYIHKNLKDEHFEKLRSKRGIYKQLQEEFWPLLFLAKELNTRFSWVPGSTRFCDGYLIKDGKKIQVEITSTYDKSDALFAELCNNPEYKGLISTTAKYKRPENIRPKGSILRSDGWTTEEKIYQEEKDKILEVLEKKLDRKDIPANIYILVAVNIDLIIKFGDYNYDAMLAEIRKEIEQKCIDKKVVVFIFNEINGADKRVDPIFFYKVD